MLQFWWRCGVGHPRRIGRKSSSGSWKISEIEPKKMVEERNAQPSSSQESTTDSRQNLEIRKAERVPHFRRFKQRDPSVFWGKDDEDAVDWLRRFDYCAKFNFWDDVEKVAVFPMFLAGTAESWYSTLLSIPNTWPELSQEFLSAFKPRDYKSIIAYKIKERKQEIGESSVDFYHHMVSLCRKFDPEMDDETIVGHLFAGLDRELLREVYPRVIDKGQTLANFYSELTLITETIRRTERADDLKRSS